MPKTANKPMEKTKLVIVKYPKAIPELGGIAGPIVNPFKLPISLINRLVTKHRGVFEVNPENYSETIPLNFKNINKENFTPKKKVTTPIITKKFENKPVVEENDEDDFVLNNDFVQD